MARSLIAILALFAAACAYTAPTSPTNTAVVTATPAAVHLLPAPLPSSGIGALSVGARDDQGTRIEAVIECESSSGQLIPKRFTTLLANDRLLNTTARTRVTCRTGTVEASTDVDLSAWAVKFLNPNWDAPGPFAGLTTVQVWAVRRMQNVHPTRLSIAWGDGTVDEIGPVPQETAWGPTHRYARNGIFQATARIEWSDGVSEASILLQGGPPVLLGHP
jgi:hypothetical protein